MPFINTHRPTNVQSFFWTTRYVALFSCSFGKKNVQTGQNVYAQGGFVHVVQKETIIKI